MYHGPFEWVIFSQIRYRVGRLNASRHAGLLRECLAAAGHGNEQAGRHAGRRRDEDDMTAEQNRPLIQRPLRSTPPAARHLPGARIFRECNGKLADGTEAADNLSLMRQVDPGE
jgi:hypothetical protein